jgi:hypothetical protein
MSIFNKIKNQIIQHLEFRKKIKNFMRIFNKKIFLIVTHQNYKKHNPKTLKLTKKIIKNSPCLIFKNKINFKAF